MEEPAPTHDEGAEEAPSAPEEGAEAPETAPAGGPAPVFRVLSAETVIFDLADASPTVHLMETEAPFRNLAVPIALPEAQALHLAMEHGQGRRPGTHELFCAALAELRCDVVAARIVRYEAGVFYAELDLMGPQGRVLLDCRTSDAIIVALRQRVPAPILCEESILARRAD